MRADGLGGPISSDVIRRGATSPPKVVFVPLVGAISADA
jgi:hypothetical protein